MATGVGILGTGHAVPAQIMTNNDLEKIVDTSDEWITTRTGIKERRIASEEEAASDLGYQAALEALQAAGLSPEQLDLIIVATVTGDKAFPSTACIIQDRLKAYKAAAFDLSAACSGFVYGLEVGRHMVRAGYRYVLVIGVDLLSRVVDFTDRSTCVLFGDGAGAVVLGEVPNGYGILAAELGADGSGGHFLEIPAGGSRKPISSETLAKREHYLRMNGPEVFKFAVRIMEEATRRAIQQAGLEAQDIRWFIPHQANIRIIQAAAQRLRIPSERIFINVHKYGNTSAASIAIALDECVRQGTLKTGDDLVLVGFGAGLTWGSLVIRWFEREEMNDE